MIQQGPTQLGVMHLVDTLNTGGTERVAVSIANQLAKHGHRSFLCTTRTEGPLSKLVSPDVGRLSLSRKRTFQWGAIRRLAKFIRSNNIGILHAHGSSIVTANLVSRMSPFPKILWHDHFGTNDKQERPVWLYRRLVRRVGGIAAVSRPLADWSLRRLHYPSDRVWCVPNFVDAPDIAPDATGQTAVELPGEPGSRIVCVANLRPVKDHLNLLAAMSRVTGQRADAQLILVGGLSDSECVTRIRQQIATDQLSENVTIFGERDDVSTIIAGCDIGVLSSTSEGLPLSLLEYGAAGLAVVVTDVGQCGAVVGDAGRIVPPSAPDQLATQILSLLENSDTRHSLGQRFQQNVNDQFGAESIMQKWFNIYDTVLRTK